MCGIAGLFDRAGHRPYALELVKRMTSAIAHRGPDGDGFYSEPGISFGHRRLSIIDLSGGSQPMSLPDGSVTVTYNGEIYNFKELRPELERLGAVFRTQSDTECLLHGWRVWGPDFVNHLRGMFAFALWDRDRGTLFLARDRLGKKPLHYACQPDGTFAFASEIKALFAYPSIDRTLDPQAVEDFFAFGYIPDPKTIYASIRKLPAAHTLTIKRDGTFTLRRYWDVAEASAQLAPRQANEEDLRERLREAVSLRLVSDVEIGAFLSGGVDSSAVVALMAQAWPNAINTFSIGFAEQQYDETSYANAVAERYHTRHRSKIITSDGFSLLERLAGIFDEPFGDVSAIPTYYVCAETSKFLKVCLSGDGGDETLAGYRRYAFHAKEERLRAVIPSFLRQPVFGLAGALYPKLDWAPRSLRAKTTFQELSLSEADAYFRILSALPDDVRRPLYSPAFLSWLNGYDSNQLVRDLFSAARHLDPLQRAQYADINLYLPGDILVKVDRTSMANSLEVRAPFLDHEFLAWAFGLPMNQKMTKRGGKALLKSAMEPLLPADLLYRPKQGFSPPLSDWLRGPLNALVMNLSKSSRLTASGLFDMGTIESRATAHLAGRSDHSKTLWLLLVFEAFLGQVAAPSNAGLQPQQPDAVVVEAERHSRSHVDYLLNSLP